MKKRALILMLLTTVGLMFWSPPASVLAQPPGCLGCIDNAVQANAQCLRDGGERTVCSAAACDAFLICVNETRCDLGAVRPPPFCAER